MNTFIKKNYSITSTYKPKHGEKNIYFYTQRTNESVFEENLKFNLKHQK